MLKFGMDSLEKSLFGLGIILISQSFSFFTQPLTKDNQLYYACMLITGLFLFIFAIKMMRDEKIKNEKREQTNELKLISEIGLNVQKIEDKKIAGLLEAILENRILELSSNIKKTTINKESESIPEQRGVTHG
jgi:hypothetical protein